MQAELAIVEALQSAGVSPEKAKIAAEAVTKAIDYRYELHSKQLSTKGDVEGVRSEMASLKADMYKALNEQTWKLAAIVFAGLGLVVAAMKMV